MTEPMSEQNGRLPVTVVTIPSLRDHRSAARLAATPPDVRGQDARFLRRVSLLLTEDLDHAALQKQAVRLPLPYLADWCALHLATPPAEGSAAAPVVCAHVDPHQEPRARTLWQRTVQTTPQAVPPIGPVLRANQRSTRPARLDVVLNQVSGDSPRSPAASLLARTGFATAVHIPLIAGTHALGVITFASMTPGRYGPRPMALAVVYANWVATALDAPPRRARSSAHVYLPDGPTARPRGPTFEQRYTW